MLYKIKISNFSEKMRLKCEEYSRASDARGQLKTRAFVEAHVVGSPFACKPFSQLVHITTWHHPRQLEYLSVDLRVILSFLHKLKKE